MAVFGSGVQNILESITHKNEKFAEHQRKLKLDAILSNRPLEEVKARAFSAPTPTKILRR